MKKSVIILLGIFVLTLFKANARDTNSPATPSDLRIMKAIVARDINVLCFTHTKDEKKVREKLDSLPIDKLSVDTIESLIPYKVHKAVVKIVNELASSPESNLEETMNSLLTKCRENEEIKNFLENKGLSYNTFLKESKKNIYKYIQQLPPMEEEAVTQKNTDRNQESFQEEPVIVYREEESGSLSLWRIISVFLVVIMIGAIVFLYYIFNAEAKKNDLLHANLKKLTLEITQVKQELTIQKEGYNTLQQKLNTCVSHLKTQQKVMREQNQENNYNSRSSNQVSYANPATQRRRIEQKQYVFNADNDGLFSSPRDQYVPQESLYCITTYDGETGEFDFINDSTAIRIAQIDRSKYIENACSIDNAEVRQFNNVITILKGKVVKNGNNWEIINKAKVRLS